MVGARAGLKRLAGAGALAAFLFVGCDDGWPLDRVGQQFFGPAWWLFEGPCQERQIKVTSPNGGEIWCYEKGAQREITWTSAGIDGNVDIGYTCGGTASPVLWEIAADVEDSGSYTWAIPNLSSAHCRVRVRERGGRTADESDGYFTILPVFSDTEAPLQGLRCGLAWADVDADGDLDLAVSGKNVDVEPVTRLYENDGSGALTETSVTLAQLFLSSLAWGDYDSDGDLDLALAGAYDGTNYISELYRNDGGTFTELDAGLPSVANCSLAWGDYDNDGDLDLAVEGQEGSQSFISTVYRNDGGGTFVDIDAGMVGVCCGSIDWADVDSDGDLDLALVGAWADGTWHYEGRIYRNDAGAFVDTGANLTALVGSLAWGDYDSDGDLDLALAGFDGADYVGKIYRNDRGTFVEIDAGLQHVQNCSVAWGDYDSDGDLDLALTGWWYDVEGHRVTTVYRNDGGVFTDIEVGLLGLSSGSLAWVDYDSDGDLDLSVAGSWYDTEWHYETKIYRNNILAANAPPSAPNGLSAAVGSGEVTFSWNAASDPETPHAALTYNLRVGTAPGEEDVMPGMSIIGGANDGKRLIPAMGNVQHNNSWALSGLASGTYCWSVQAVDTAFCGSPWAPEGAFTVP